MHLRVFFVRLQIQTQKIHQIKFKKQILGNSFLKWNQSINNQSINKLSFFKFKNKKGILKHFWVFVWLIDWSPFFLNVNLTSELKHDISDDNVNCQFGNQLSVGDF
jgi:hypothetical protein